jgi:hypothetical protein
MIDQNFRRVVTLRSRTTRRTPLNVVKAAGRTPFALEQVEPRVLLAGDHPSLPGTWGPFPPGPTADVVTTSANGIIGAGDTGDLFKFVMPGAPGAKDFVSILADTSTVSVNHTVSVSSLAGAAGVVTATTATAHGFQLGDKIVISGASPAGYNGIFDITAIVDATHFRYANATTGASSGTILAAMADGSGGTLPNDGKKVDTYVELYDKNGNLLMTGANNSNGFAGVVSVGLNSLLPSADRAPDGWTGFEGTGGETYYVRVKADPTPVSGRDSVGRYVLKISGPSTVVPVDQHPDIMFNMQTVPNIDFGRAFDQNSLTVLQQDRIYRITTPDDPRFNSVSTFAAIADDNTLLNPHIDVYSVGNASGIVTHLTGDTDAGRQTDSFTTSLTTKNTTYYIRVRSDDLRPAPAGQPLGVYQMVARFAASDIPIDPETRLGLTGLVVTAHDDPADPWTNVPLVTPSLTPASPTFTPRMGTDSKIFKFTAQGTGLGIVTVVAMQAIRPPPPAIPNAAVGPMPQPAMRLFDANGGFIDFNKGNGAAQLLTSVVGGHTYYLVVEGFDNAADGGFQIFIEGHHTNDVTQPVDDHINTPLDQNGNPISSIPAWELATPLRFGDPFQSVDLNNQPVRDREWLQTATGRGRIQATGDTDLFQFTAPVNQLSNYAGSDNNNSLPLYVGGNFNQAGLDPRTGLPYNDANTAIYDGGSWFNTGPETEATGAINGPVFAYTTWDPDGSAGPLPTELVAGGRFTMVNGAPAGNLAFRLPDTANGQYVWSASPFTLDGSNPVMTNGTVFALAAGDVIPSTSIQQMGITADELYVGGQFTSLAGTATNNIGAFYEGPLGFTGDGMNGGVTGGTGGPVVRAITIWDPPSPGTFPAKPIDPNATTPDMNTGLPPSIPDLPKQVFFGGTFANGFATNPARDPMNPQRIPGPITGINNVANWGVRDTSENPPVLQGNGLPNGFNITWGFTGTPMTMGMAVPTGYGVNGPVNALTSWDDPGQMLINGMLMDIPERLIIGGNFTSSGGVTPSGSVPAPGAVAARNIIAYDYTMSGNGFIMGFPPAAPNIPAAARFENIGNLGATQIVRALTTWHADVYNGGTTIDNSMDQTLLEGGDNTSTTTGILQSLNSSGTIGTGWTPHVVGTDGTVRAVTTFKNDMIGYAPGHVGNVSSDFETIFIGGDFTMVNFGNGPTPANHVARMDVTYAPRNETWDGMDNGTHAVSPGEAPGTISGVYALHTFQDNIPGVWDRNERAASRVQITLSATPDSFVDPNFRVRVFDSTFHVVYQNNQLDPTNQDPITAGSNDPSLIPVFPNAGIPYWVQPNPPFPGFKVWAGEVYYVEVSDPGGGTGRYTLGVTTDALAPRPDPATQDVMGVYPDGIATQVEPVGKGQFETAPMITIDGNGKGKPFLNPLANPATPPSAYTEKFYNMTPDGVGRTEYSDTPVISRITDTHIYQFRAPNDGTAEIRISTLGITRAYQEATTDQDGNITSQPVMAPAPLDGVNAKTINSPLHAGLRVYNNDRVQVGYSDGNEAVSGFGDAFQTYPADNNRNPPDDGVRDFTHSDPRLVINVRKGNVYFIEVESAYLGAFQSNPDLVDWRHATGAYDIVISTSQAINGGSTVDDFWPNFDTGGQPPVDGVHGTVIPIDRQTGAGTISGNIHNTPTGAFANPNDADSFTIITEGRGFFQVRVTPTTPTLSPRVRVYDDTATLVTTNSGGVGGVASLQFAVTQGQRFFIVVDGAGTEGNYIVDVTSPVQPDDQTFSNAQPNDLGNPLAFWANAKPLQLNRFLGLYGDQTGGTGPTGPLMGSIENPDDRDLYKFSAETYETATLNVTKVDATLNPFVIVWEISRDGSGGGTPVGGVGKEVFLIIGINDDASGTDTNSQVSFSITPGRDYYIQVSGSNLNTDFGRYMLAVHVSPSDDHPNDPLLPLPSNNPDPGQPSDFPNGSIIPLAFDPINFTSTGTIGGVIERTGDTDLFKFTAQATGTAHVNLAQEMGSTLALNAVVLDGTNTPIGGITFSGSASSITSNNFNVTSGQVYYIVVRAGTPSGGTTDTGGYNLTVSTDPIDDYLPTPGTSTPSAGDFAGAANIPLAPSNGIGTQNGTLVPTGDTDLFKFTTIQAGTVTVRISTPLSVLNPSVIIFDSSHVQVFSAGGNGDSSQVSFTATAGSQQFFVLVLADPTATGINSVGGYTVTVSNPMSGGPGGGPGPDDYPNAGEWADAAVIGLDTRTGFGSITGNIAPAGDTDLFQFTVPGNGFIDLQLNTPTGGLVDGQLRVFNSAHTQVFFDAAGNLGSTAAIRIPGAVAGDQYFVLVEPVGTAQGSYTLRVQATPVTNYLYFPEGFTGATIDEFLPMVNPNNFDVSVQVFARYETGANPNTPIYSGVIAAHTRGGITISTRSNPAADLVRAGVGYSLEVQSTGPIGATFSHYDFDSAVGEALTNRVSTVWTFAEANKDHNNFRDFLLFYNPGNTTANLNVSLYYQDGTVSTFAATVDSLRRGGINFDTDTRVTRTGKFGIRIDSDQPIVASVTSYNLPRSGGDGVLGDADGGNINGVVTNITSGGGAFSTISIVNTNSQPATVTITADYGRTDIPKLVRVYTVGPNSQFNKNLAAVGLIPGQTAGITYSSNIPVTFQALEYKYGDGDSTTTATSVARDYFFGDLFVNPALAGIKYIEQLGLYNPGQVAIDISATFVFNDGSTAPATFHVNPGTFAFVQIDQQAPIIGHNGLAFFSLLLDSASPYIASMTHYDLFLNGGWSALGAPLGLTNPLSSVLS